MEMNAASFIFFHAVVEIKCWKLPAELEIYEVALGKTNDNTGSQNKLCNVTTDWLIDKFSKYSSMISGLYNALNSISNQF